MDIDGLKAFLFVARCGSFSGAAAQLHLTQPAISKRIAALETELDTPLFDRINRRVHLTTAGQSLLPRAESILAEITAAKNAINDLSGDVRGELRIATSHHIGLHKLPPILRRFSQRYGNVNLQIEFLDSEVAHTRVLEGHCELAVVTLAPTPADNLLTEPLWQDPLVFVTHHQVPAPTPTDLRQLSQAAAILPDLATFTGRIVKSLFDQHGLSISLNMSTNYLETIKMMVSVGLGWSVLPRSMLDEHLSEIPIPAVTLNRTLGLVLHSRRHRSRAAEALAGLLREASAEQLANL